MILARPVKALARRMALMQASVPEFTKRTCSMEGKARQYQPGQLHLLGYGGTKAGAPLGGSLDGFHHLRIGMAQDQGAPGAQVVHVLVVVHVPYVGALSSGDEHGVSTNGTK